MATVEHDIRYRVLHVEDDTFVAALVQATLGDAGFDVDWHSNGETALAAAREADYGAYLVDLGLPGMRGSELAEQLRGLSAGVPIVYVTGEPELVQGEPWVLAKPFPPSALVEMLGCAVGVARRAA
jgi:DNA-binding response OmpR family regulator